MISYRFFNIGYFNLDTYIYENSCIFIYTLPLFLSLLYIFIFFGREELKRYIYKDGWKGGRVAGMAEQK
jgi:hypothetical protein